MDGMDPCRLAEGWCPVRAHGELERMPDYGWCPDCGLGWSTNGIELSVHLRPRVPDVLAGPSKED